MLKASNLINYRWKLQQWRNYVSGLDSIVWVVGGVTTARFNSRELDPPALSRISLYSWQIAQKWQKKWVTKSPQGASCITFQRLKGVAHGKIATGKLTHRLSLKRNWPKRAELHYMGGIKALEPVPCLVHRQTQEIKAKCFDIP